MDKDLNDILTILQDTHYWNRQIQNMDEESIKPFESAIHSLQEKISKKVRYGTINVS